MTAPRTVAGEPQRILFSVRGIPLGNDFPIFKAKENTFTIRLA